MVPAKVTSGDLVFFVSEGEEIGEVDREEDLSTETLDFLVYSEIHGTHNGFKVEDVDERKKTRYYTEVGISEKSASQRGNVMLNGVPVIQFSDGTKIEPVTKAEMKWYKKHNERW